eukprot:COSAG02_NODE_6887_length_3307_cov_2.238155_5_plen_127_part_00
MRAAAVLMFGLERASLSARDLAALTDFWTVFAMASSRGAGLCSLAARNSGAEAGRAPPPCLCLSMSLSLSAGWKPRMPRSALVCGNATVGRGPLGAGARPDRDSPTPALLAGPRSVLGQLCICMGK